MKQVLLTGATGAIGSAVVPRLLAEPQTTVWALIRARDDTDLARRRADLLAWCGIAPSDDRADRFQALRGDIVEDDFGLSPDLLSSLPGRISHILHCAASVKLNMSLEQARATAVKPTRTALALARRCADAGTLRKLDIVSTVGVWGRTPGCMPERPLPEVTTFHNTYEAAKSEAERVVWDEGRGLPVTVHRPSMVVGDSASGRIVHFQVFYHLCEFLTGARTLGVMPGLGTTRLDTVPVDWVARVLTWAGNEPASAGQVLHLCSGPTGAIPLTRLQQRVRALWQARGRPAPPLRQVPRGLLAAAVPVLGLVLGASTRRALRGLKPVLEYLDEDQSFDNRQTQATLAAAGLPVPPVDGYLDAVLGHYLDQRAQRDTGSTA